MALPVFPSREAPAIKTMRPRLREGQATRRWHFKPAATKGTTSYNRYWDLVWEQDGGHVFKHVQNGPKILDTTMGTMEVEERTLFFSGRREIS